jgi:hypothetical protein
MSELGLKAGATALTLAAAAAAAFYVTGHLRNAGAPLQPAVVSRPGASPAADGRLAVSSGVTRADLPPVTSTYAS